MFVFKLNCVFSQKASNIWDLLEICNISWNEIILYASVHSNIGKMFVFSFNSLHGVSLKITLTVPARNDFIDINYINKPDIFVRIFKLPKEFRNSEYFIQNFQEILPIVIFSLHPVRNYSKTVHNYSFCFRQTGRFWVRLRLQPTVRS